MDDTETKHSASGSGAIDRKMTREHAPESSGDVADSMADRPDNAEAGENFTPSKVLPREYGGRKGPEPTRYGDWEKNGRCIDF